MPRVIVLHPFNSAPLKFPLTKSRSRLLRNKAVRSIAPYIQEVNFLEKLEKGVRNYSVYKFSKAILVYKLSKMSNK